MKKYLIFLALAVSVTAQAQILHINRGISLPNGLHIGGGSGISLYTSEVSRVVDNSGNFIIDESSNFIIK